MSFDRRNEKWAISVARCEVEKNSHHTQCTNHRLIFCRLLPIVTCTRIVWEIMTGHFDTIFLMFLLFSNRYLWWFLLIATHLPANLELDIVSTVDTNTEHNNAMYPKPAATQMHQKRNINIYSNIFHTANSKTASRIFTYNCAIRYIDAFLNFLTFKALE